MDRTYCWAEPELINIEITTMINSVCTYYRYFTVVDEHPAQSSVGLLIILFL